LHDYAVLLGFFGATPGVVSVGGGGSGDIELEMDGFEADGNFFGDAEGAAKIQVAIHSDFDAFGRNGHGGRDHLTGDLSARGERAQKQVARAGTGAGAADALVGFGLVDGAAEYRRRQAMGASDWPPLARMVII